MCIEINLSKTSEIRSILLANEFGQFKSGLWWEWERYVIECEFVKFNFISFFTVKFSLLFVYYCSQFHLYSWRQELYGKKRFKTIFVFSTYFHFICCDSQNTLNSLCSTCGLQNACKHNVLRQFAEMIYYCYYRLCVSVRSMYTVCTIVPSYNNMNRFRHAYFRLNYVWRSFPTHEEKLSISLCAATFVCCSTFRCEINTFNCTDAHTQQLHVTIWQMGKNRVFLLGNKQKNENHSVE